MGLLDKLFGKREAPMVKEINRVEICFDLAKPLYDESRVVEDLIQYFGLDKSFTPDVHISTSYGAVPDVAEALKAGNTPKELTSFLIARALIIGFDEEEIEKIVLRPFNSGGILGVLIAGRVKEPWG